MRFKKIFWYKREIIDFDTGETTTFVTGIVSVPFWIRTMRVYGDLQRICERTVVDVNSKWMITDFKRI